MKNSFSLSDYTDSKKMIAQIKYISNRCNRFIISGIRDFWTF